jgi:hypothetical protein
VFMGWLGAQRPDLVERYERLYSRGAYAPHDERERLAGLVRGRTPRTRGFRRIQPPFGGPASAAVAAPQSRQEALF